MSAIIQVTIAMSELLTCPFCGSEASERTVGDYFQIGCPDYACLAYIVDMRLQEAVNDWNTRVERMRHIVPMDAAGNPPYRKGDLIMNSLSDGCSKCGCPFDTLNYGVPNYCPNCGAKVVE